MGDYYGGSHKRSRMDPDMLAPMDPYYGGGMAIVPLFPCVKLRGGWRVMAWRMN